MNDAERIQKAQQIVNGFGVADWNGLKGLLTPNAIYDEVGTQRKTIGPDQIIQAFQGWKQAMSDAKGTIQNSHGLGNVVALEISWQGTHTGPITTPTGTIPPSGRRQTTQAAMIVKFQGDKIHEIRHYFDMVTLLQQIGAMSPAHA